MRQNGSERELAAADALTGASLIAAERQRQVEVEGYTLSHDEQHGAHRLMKAAQTYEFQDGRLWPFAGIPKFKNVLRDLIRAGALCQAAADISINGEFARRDRDRCAAKIDAILAEVARLKILLAEFGSGPKDKKSANEREPGAEPWEYGVRWSPGDAISPRKSLEHAQATAQEYNVTVVRRIYHVTPWEPIQ